MKSTQHSVMTSDQSALVLGGLADLNERDTACYVQLGAEIIGSDSDRELCEVSRHLCEYLGLAQMSLFELDLVENASRCLTHSNPTTNASFILKPPFNPASLRDRLQPLLNRPVTDLQAIPELYELCDGTQALDAVFAVQNTPNRYLLWCLAFFEEDPPQLSSGDNSRCSWLGLLANSVAQKSAQLAAQMRQEQKFQHLNEILQSSDLDYLYWTPEQHWAAVRPEYADDLDNINSQYSYDLNRNQAQTSGLDAMTPALQDSHQKLEIFKTIQKNAKTIAVAGEPVACAFSAVKDLKSLWLENAEQKTAAESDQWLNEFLLKLFNEGDIDTVVESLQDIAQYFGAVRCYVVTYDNIVEGWQSVYEWVAPQQRQVLDVISTEEMAEVMVEGVKVMDEFNALEISDVKEFPSTIMRDFFCKLDITSILQQSMTAVGAAEGYVGIACKETREWSELDIRTLKICSESIYQVLLRLKLLHQYSKSEERFYLAMKVSSSGIWERDVDDRNIYFSPTFYNMLGYAEHEAGKNLRELMNSWLLDEDKPKIMALYNEFYQSTNQDEIYHEARHKHKDGHVSWIAGRGKVVQRDKKGFPKRIVGANTDITELKLSLQALETAQKEAIAANVSKGEFLARMSHEIRTPMNAILGMAYLLRQTELNEEQQSHIEDIDLAATTLLNIIDDILDFSKIEAGTIAIENQPFDLHQELQRIVKLISLKVAEKQVGVRLTVDDDVPTLLTGDRTRIGQVITNLLSNAAKFTHEGEIALEVRLVSDQETNNSIMVLFSVSDTGIGLSDEQCQHLFKPFEQAESSTTRRFGGTGLGLSISKNLIEIMGGNISVISKVDVGTTFHFTIMFKKSDVALEKFLEEQRPKSHQSNQKNLLGKHVLLVEDNLVNQKVAQGILAKFGVEVTIANNGREALNQLNQISQKHFDAVLMDIEMPVLDGLSATQKIRAIPSPFQRIPIIAMTAHAMTGDIEKCLTVGMNAHISKPIKPDRIFDTLIAQIH